MNHPSDLWLTYVLLLFVAPSICGQTNELSTAKGHIGVVNDWTSHRLIVSGGLTERNLRLGEIEPRVRLQLETRFGPPVHQVLSQLPASNLDDGNYVTALTVVVDGMTTSNPQRRSIDWSVPLGSGNVAPYQYSAKYGFYPNLPPDCINDYVVFPLNVVGVTSGQANLVGINNLYSGPSGTPPCGAAPTINWAYNGSTGGGKVQTSPILSLDGTKILYVETVSSSSILHVLTWKAGEGTSVTSAVAPVKVGSCTATTSCLKSLTYSTTTDVATSPWLDYSSDKVFVASNNGMVYRISCGFTCSLNSNPTVEWSFKLPVKGTGGSTAVPTNILYDDSTGHLIVTDSLGEVWTINAGGATPSVAFGPMMVGGGGCTTTNPPSRTGTPVPCTANGKSYGIAADGMSVDLTTGMIFAFSGNDGTAGASAVAVQMPQTLASQVRVHIGLGSVGNTLNNVDLHGFAADNAYFGNTPSSGHLIFCGTGTSDTTPWQYWIGFSSYPVMDSMATQGIQQIATPGVPCSGFTEFYNPNINLLNNPNDHDLLISGLNGSGTNGNIFTDDISNIPPGPAPITYVNYPGGTSGVVIDNVGTQPQESSMYFTTLQAVTVGSCSASRCAVKLTQLNLQ